MTLADRRLLTGRVQFSQLSLIEAVDDGEALFFGLPVQPRFRESDASPLHTLLESTFLKPDTKHGGDVGLIHENDPDEGLRESSESTTDSGPSTSLPPTEKGFPTKTNESVAMESPQSVPGYFLLPNSLQTEETTSNSLRQPANVVTMASFIRSVVALARPLTAQQPKNLQNLFLKSNREPLRDMLSLAEGLIGRVGSKITKQNPFDFLNLIDNMQNAIDRMGGEGECTVIIELIDQTAITLKELIQAMNAVQKLGDMWSAVNISGLRKCVRKRVGIPAEATPN